MIENSLCDALRRSERSHRVRSSCVSYADVFEFVSFCGRVIYYSHIISGILASERSHGSFNRMVAGSGDVLRPVEVCVLVKLFAESGIQKTNLMIFCFM